MRACVVDSPELGTAYSRLAECDVECMAVVPSIDHVDPHLLVEHDIVLVGCSAAELESSRFQTSVARIARTIPAVAIVGPGADPATAADAGFRGFLDRNVSPDALERTLRAVLDGELAFPRSSVLGIAQQRGNVPQGEGEASVTLTRRQRQIVALIAQGATDREIADRLRISQSTAHKHVQNALRRSNARTRSQLVAFARYS